MGGGRQITLSAEGSPARAHIESIEMISGSYEPFAYQTSNILTSPLPSPSSIRWPPDWPHNNKLVKLPHCRVPGPSPACPAPAPRDKTPGLARNFSAHRFFFFRTHRPTIKYVYYTTGGQAGRPFQRLSGSLSRADGSTARYLPPLPALKECVCVCCCCWWCPPA